MSDNKYILHLLIRVARAVCALALFSFGIYMSMQAQLGIAPWDVFTDGLSQRLCVSYGTASVLISICVMCADLLLKEKIGLGTVLDALLVGPITDAFLSAGWIPAQNNLWKGLLYLLIGVLVMSYAQYLHISSAICCGPRDALLVAVGKRLPHFPIGAVNTVITVVVLLLGWLMGGSVGLGTLVMAGSMGFGIQLVARIKGFDPRNVMHLTFSDMLRQKT